MGLEGQSVKAVNALVPVVISLAAIFVVGYMLHKGWTRAEDKKTISI